MILVLYHPEHDLIRLWANQERWPGKEFVAWRYLDTVIECGWEVIGEL